MRFLAPKNKKKTKFGRPLMQSPTDSPPMATKFTTGPDPRNPPIMDTTVTGKIPTDPHQN